jgi:hypothetical protein
LPLERFFFEERLDAHTTCFAAEMTTESISTCEAASTTPSTALFEVAPAHKLLLA